MSTGGDRARTTPEDGPFRTAKDAKARRMPDVPDSDIAPAPADMGGNVDQQAIWLRRGSMQSAQRLALASQIGQVHGNRYLQRAIASLEDRGPRPNVESSIAEMRADVDTIVGFLKQQSMGPSEQLQAFLLVDKWSKRDDQHRAATGYAGTDYLDRFLVLLKTRTYSRRTFRTMWVEAWASAYDDLWHELEGGILSAFQSVVAKSKKQGTRGPESERQESAWSAIGKQEAMGGLGILKAMGLALGGVVDTAVWVCWKQGMPLRQALQMAGVDVSSQPPSIRPYLDTQFDELAKVTGDLLGVDRDKDESGLGKSAYRFGELWGQVPANLMLVGTASGMSKAEGALKAAGQVLAVAQAAQAAEALYDQVQKLRNGSPPMTWAEIAKRPDVWVQVVGVVAGAIGAAGGFAQADSKVAEVCTKLGMTANLAQVPLLVAAYYAVDEDPRFGTPEAKQKAREELLVQMATTGLTAVDMRYGPGFEKAWARWFQKGTGQVAPGAEPVGPAGATETARPVEEPTSPTVGAGEEAPARQGEGSQVELAYGEVDLGPTPEGSMELAPGDQPTREVSYGEFDLGPTPEGSISTAPGDQPTREASHREIDLGPLPAGKGPSLYRGSKPANRIPGVRRVKPKFGEASSEKSGTHHRTGMAFNELNAAEIVQGLRVDYDLVAGRPSRVSYRVDGDTRDRKAETDRSFTQDESTEGAQPTNRGFEGSGKDKGHLAQREAFKGYADAERAADQMTNIVPMTEKLNRGAGSPWRAAEERTIDLAEKYGAVTVEVEPVYDKQPQALPDGTPIPSSIVRRVKNMDGKVLEEITFQNQ